MTFKKPHYYLLPSLLLTGHVMAASPSHCNSLSTAPIEPKYPLLHVASPDWREQIIYFVMPDRFFDGDPSNNDQGTNEYGPTDKQKYSGGDLQGLIDKLTYIKGLGATAIWTTPVVANIWWDSKLNMSGYHGYWARHFKQVDEHMGTLDTYKALSNALHQNGMYIIQDVVVNHTGNFCGYDGEYNPADPSQNFKCWSETKPTVAPTQAPFNRNGPIEGIYHWHCPITTDAALKEELCEFAELDDLNTENLLVRQALCDSYGWWIKTVGIDGFRLDTAKYVPHDFWNNFFYAKDTKAPGIRSVAAATGRCDFLSFGEVYESSKPFDDAGEQQVFSYLGTDDKPEIKSMLQFPLAYTIKRVFAEGKPTAYLGYRLNKHLELSGNPSITPVFIDNHDQARFASKGSRAALKQALTFIMTIPGIPVIWQGTEQALTETRASMFAKGFGSGGVAHFDTQSEMYLFIKKLADIRKSHRVFTRGSLKVLADKSITRGVGVFAYQRVYKGTTAIVVFNTSEQATLLDTETGLPSGSQLKLLMGEGMNDDIVVNKDGRFSTELPARAVMVLIHEEGDTAPIETSNVKITFTTAVEGNAFTEDVVLNGTVTAGVIDLKLIVDGFLERAIDFNANADGNWQVVLPVSEFGMGEEKHIVSVYAPKEGAISDRLTFKSNVVPDNVIKISQTDSAGDDRGLQGTYHYPTDKSFTNQMDIQQVEVTAGNTTLDINFTMPVVTDGWSPPNQFDHVSFNVYFDLPNQKGLSVLPKIKATAPDGFMWDYSSVVYSGGNSFHSTEYADADNLGKPVNGAADIRVDKENGTILFRYDAFYFGLENWEGVKVYATTWDIDSIENIYRPLNRKAGQYHFGGGSSRVDPLIADDIEVITLR
jgi:glycosidase